ncbi:MAG: DegV family protein [Kouleothrix sp.]
MIKLVVDSTADLPHALYREYDITVVPVLAQFGAETLRDDIDFTRDEFYTRLVASPEPPKTAAPSVGMFETAFRSLADAGHQILSLSLAGGLSGTYNAARQAAALVEGATITCVDSYTVIHAAGLPDAQSRPGHPRWRHARSGRRAGRAPAYEQHAVRGLRNPALPREGRADRPMRALLGSMLSVKPIMEVRLSEVLPLEQVRTWKRVPPRMIELAQARGSFDQLGVLYTTTRGSAEQLADLCAAAGLMPREQIYVQQAGGVLGTHAGPGALGLAGLLK